MKFSIKDFFSKCDQIRRKLRIWSHLLKKSSMEIFIFCAVIFLSSQNCHEALSLSKLLRVRIVHRKQIELNLRLLKKSLMENFIFCTVNIL